MSTDIVPSNSQSPLSYSSVEIRSQPNYLEQIKLLTTHPFFTGCCPNCSHKLSLVDRQPGKGHCDICGWSELQE